MNGNGLVVAIADFASVEQKAAWDAFVNNTDGAFNYHRSGWLEVIEKTFGHTAYPLMASDASGSIRGILPVVLMKSKIFGNFITSLPFFNYGGILAKNGEAAGALVAKAEELVTQLGVKFLELRHRERTVEGLPTKHHKVTMLLDLPADPDVLWKGFKAKVRNQVRKASKSGLTCQSGGMEYLDLFYEVFARNMRDLGTPVYSRNLFRNTLEAYPEHTRIFTVHHPDGCVAAGFATWFQGVFEIPWASSIRDYNPLCPNNLLYWEMLEYACRNGCRRFDFGRSTPGEGTYRFKKQWGAEPMPLHWQYVMNGGGELPEMSPGNAKFKLAIKVWRKLPLPLTKLIGPGIVRNIP